MDTHLEVRATLICLWPNEMVPANLSQSSNMSTVLSRSCSCAEAEPDLIRTLIRTLTALLHLGEMRGKQRGEFVCFLMFLYLSVLVLPESCRVFDLR